MKTKKMKTKNVNFKKMLGLTFLLFMLCSYVSQAQINYPVKNLKNCSVTIDWEINDGGVGVCDFGTIVVPANGSVLIGNGGSCGTTYNDVHIVLKKVGAYTVTGASNNVGGPPLVILSQGTTQNGTVPAGNPCSGAWNMAWAASGTTIW
jgi:hypothetical protein